MQGLNSLVLIIFFELFVYGNAVPKQDWKSEEITNLMTLLMNYGERELIEYNSHIEETEKHVKQFLVASVLSESEMTDSRNWQHIIPESITKDNARIDVIFNSKNYTRFPYKTKKPLHGEVLMLLEREDLPKMINNLKETTYPYVVLYSHYIPCCDLKGVEYSCSEELANAAISEHDKYTMLVGYKELFNNTNWTKSLAFMNSGGIKIFQIENGVFQPKFTNDKILNKTERILQVLFYKCLDGTLVSNCCIADANDSDKKKKKILSMFVNEAVYNCTSDSLKSYQGNLTGANTLGIRKCIYKYVEYTIGNDCPKCGANTTKNSVKLCALYASEFGTVIGRPSNLQEPYLPSWEKGPPAWGSLYKGYNRNALVNRPKVLCLKKPNSIKTLCTQLEIKPTEITEAFKDKDEKIRN